MPRSRIKRRSHPHRHLIAIPLIFLNIIAPFQISAFTSLHQGESSEGASTVSALAAARATLPCDVTPRGANDTLLLVVWYREDTPIYSYDTRVKGPLAHWSERAALGARAHFTPRAPSGLQLEDTREADAGEYRCRVDFKVSPTRNYKVVLNVVVLPSKPVIFDENGKEVQSFTGPYTEGGHFQLTCVVSGGKPPPLVRWLREGLAAGAPGPSPARIRVANVTRSELHAHYRCEATNTPLAPPVAATVQIEMHLKPLSVSILSREQPLSAGRPAALTCQVAGARPPALITWWVDGVQVPPTEKQAQDFEDVNMTMSTLTYVPTMEHHGKTLICRAEHRTIPNSSIDSSLQLNVFYAPIVVLELGSNLNPHDIEEGDDVYFECKVKANPPAYKVVWEHNGIVMQHNQKAGVIAGGAHLALQSVARQQAGRYGCTASNVEGDGRSQPVDLAVMYKPVCRDELKSKYGVAKLEKVRVLCAVDSYPKPVSFAWFFNNTAQSLEVTKDKYTEEHNASRSQLSYVPVTDMDYGTLLCWASNMAGRQARPCVFTLHPAVRPDSLLNCTIDNQTRDSFEVNCIPGNDGGSKQTFQLEVWAERDELQANLSSTRPTFRLSALGAGRVLRLAVFAANAHGRSDPVQLAAMTHEPEADTHTGPHSSLEMTSLVGIFIGALLTFAIFVCIGTVVIRMKKKMADQYNVQSVKQHKVTLPTVHTQDRDSPPGDEKNPDVVPLNKAEAKYAGSYAPENRAPEPPPYAPPASHSAHSLHRIAALNSPKSEDGRMMEVVRPRTGTRREVVTTRTPLLAAAQQESCV